MFTAVIFPAYNEKGLYAVTALDAVQEGVIDYPHPSDPKMCDPTNDKNSNHIFDWFTQNHGGFTRKKKDHTIQTTKSPNARDEVYFKEYMKPQDGDADMASTKLKAISLEEIIWPHEDKKKHEDQGHSYKQPVQKIISMPVDRYKSEVLQDGLTDRRGTKCVIIKQVLPDVDFNFRIYKSDCRQCNFDDLKKGTKVEFEIKRIPRGGVLAKHIRIIK